MPSMGSAERRKGARGELEIVGLLPGARKVSAMYKPGPDVEWRNRTIEVKRRASGFATDYHWLTDAQLVLKRADRKPWLVTLELDTLLDLLDEARLDKPGHDLEWRNRTIEVKRRASGFQTDYKWLTDAQIVLKRSDRKPWLVTLELDTLLDLLDEARLEQI